MTPTDSRLHDLPLPITWDLLATLYRRVPPPLAGTLAAIFDEAVFRTMVLDPVPAPGGARAVLGMSSDASVADANGAAVADAIDRAVSRFAPLRREWLDVAREAVGDAGVTPLRVEAIALARGVATRLRCGPSARDDLETALGDVGRALSVHGVAVRAGRRADGGRLRDLSTRADWCLSTVLLGDFGGVTFLHPATPFLHVEARRAAAALREEIARPAAAPCTRGPRSGASPRARTIVG